MSELPSSLSIQPPQRDIYCEAKIPGSKSLTNRALLLAALCDHPVTLRGALFSEDTQLMSEALRQIGFNIVANGATGAVLVTRQERGLGAAALPDTSQAPVDLFVGNAGTAARFLTALCAAAPKGIFRIDGVEQMRRRPMKGLIDALRQLGAEIRCITNEGFFPIEIHSRGLSGGTARLDASESSQMLSALLMIAPLANRPVELELIGNVRWPFVKMTAALMSQFGQPAIKISGNRIEIPVGNRYRCQNQIYEIEPDATAASYFLALPLVTGGEITLPGLHGPGDGLQGDTRFVEVLSRVGVKIEGTSNGLRSSWQKGSQRKGVTEDFSGFSDTFLTLGAISPLLEGPTRISGIAHTRKQETDRVAGLARELRKLGQEVKETEDSLEIEPRPLKPGVEIETYRDHRFAMSFAILACHDLLGNGRSWLRIKDPACCSKTFPKFFDVLAACLGESPD